MTSVGGAGGAGERRRDPPLAFGAGPPQFLGNTGSAVHLRDQVGDRHTVGVATFAAGMACEGVKPVVAIYSTFLQRGYDQLIHDVALQNLPVVFALDRAGIVGADGPTHAGAYDIPYLRCIPNMSIACPSDENECRKLLTTAFEQDHPVAVRYPRGAGSGAAIEPGLDALPFGKGEGAPRRAAHRDPGVRHAAASGAGGGRAHGRDGGQHALGQAAGHRSCCSTIAARHEALVTVEEGAVMGGAGSAVGEALQAAGVLKPRAATGPARRIHRSTAIRRKLLALQGLDAAGIEASIRAALRRLVAHAARSKSSADALTRSFLSS